jgi:hypothetical protein
MATNVKYSYINEQTGKTVQFNAKDKEEADNIARGVSITKGQRYIYSHKNIIYQGREMQDMT